jgi:ribonuclease D
MAAQDRHDLRSFATFIGGSKGPFTRSRRGAHATVSEKLPRIIGRTEELEELRSRAQQAGIVGFDTESNGFYAYHERLCLLQLQVEQSTFLVDPQAFAEPEGLQPLLHLLADPRIVKISHGAEFDVLALKRELATSLRGLFDTMRAASLLKEPGLSLDKLVLRHFGVRLDKSYQRFDWGRRPLPPKALEYAARDVQYLLPLHQLLGRGLEEKKLISRATIEFAKVERMTPKPRVFDPTGYRRLRGWAQLDGPSREALGRLFFVREEIARRADVAPFRVLNTETLLRLAQLRPATPRELAATHGLPGWLLPRYQAQLLAALARTIA